MMKTFILFTFGSFYLFLFSCRRLELCRDEELGTKKQMLNTTLKTNGYYYSSNGPDYKNDTSYGVIYLYRDGTCIYTSSTSTRNSLLEFEERISDGTYYRGIKEIKSAWMVANISNQDLHFEGWNPTLFGCFKKMSISGKIINDTTLVISDLNNKVYQFKQFVKPDSTNNFIK